MPGRRRVCSTSLPTAASRHSASSMSSTAYATVASPSASSPSTRRRRDSSVAERTSEPASFYWTVGVAASVALHVSLIAGVALLAGRYAQASVPTEITFSDEGSPSVDPLKARAEAAAPSEVAKAAEQERVVPASISEASLRPQAEAVKPLAGESARPEALQPTETAALAPEKI